MWINNSFSLFWQQYGLTPSKTGNQFSNVAPTIIMDIIIIILNYSHITDMIYVSKASNTGMPCPRRSLLCIVILFEDELVDIHVYTTSCIPVQPNLLLIICIKNGIKNIIICNFVYMNFNIFNAIMFSNNNISTSNNNNNNDNNIVCFLIVISPERT